jgi:hypothetical protein
MPAARRFPPPWTLDEANDACFIVRDHNGQALAYVYFEDEPGRRSAAKLLTRDVRADLVRRLATREARGFNGFVTDYIACDQQTAIGIVHKVRALRT